jgi:hypothetical protein
MKTFILNKNWNVDDLLMISKTKVVKGLIYDYLDNPNCRPYDWIAGQDISDLEKASFIYTLVK